MIHFPFPHLSVIRSSSKGNSYAISAGEDVLLIEAGVLLKDVRRFVDMARVKGLLVTHRHNDHAGRIKDYFKRVPIYSNEDVITYFGIKNGMALKDGVTVKIASFNVTPFNVIHYHGSGELCPTFGYLINHPQIGSILFVTDTYMLPFRFENINHFIIEANYLDKLLDREVRGFRTRPYQRDRIVLSHMSLPNCITTIRQCGVEVAKTITLIHLSGRHADDELFQTEVEKAFGIPTYIASPGMIVPLIDEDYATPSIQEPTQV